VEGSGRTPAGTEGSVVHLNGLDIVLMALVGLVAGAINAVVGSGTLLTFPLLLALGYPPVVANVSNTVGLVPGSVMGAFGYRTMLVGQAPRLRRLGVMAVLGGCTGAALLLALPPSAFREIVPVLVGAGCVLVVLGPRLGPWLQARRTHHPGHPPAPALLVSVFVVAVYGGYFGAAQGVLLIGVMGIFLDESLQRINAAKNVLAGLTNCTAGIIFIVASHVAWVPAVLIAGGSAVGGGLGARFGRHLPPVVLRGLIVVIGVVTIVTLTV
jgi:uncharacterized protein